MSNVITLVLGGGRGSRLYPLTKFRAKPAVPLGGKYRLIDIPLSNCINSGLNRIYVLTQFLSVSLHRHIRRSYVFDNFDGGFVELLAAQQTNEATDWFQGTADAVRQHIRYIQEPGIDYVLILSGDQLYRMDYRQMIRTHEMSKADVTIAALPVDRTQAAGFGIMRLDDSGRVMGFLEKPKTEAELAHVRTDPSWIDRHGIESRGRDCLASMGIYLFNRDRLVDVLTKTDYHDFGKEIFPTSIRTHRVQVHLFDGYWEDIGTIKAFYQANLDLCQRSPAFELNSSLAPLYTRARFLPPSVVEGATIRNSLISDGCTIEEGATIENSIIGLRCRIGRNVKIRNSIVMGNDFYQMPDEIAADTAAGFPLIGIGDGSLIDGVIVDKNCRIGRSVHVVNEQGLEESPDTGAVMIRDGILVVHKEATLPDGWRMPKA
ncbi:MAG TPA: glucose-1-phosphate adenylyltransferase [Pirellulales bacterium]|nr:glucose-1-phosphate adenylyltransferase [Pirellulales bacterium]